MTISLPNDEIKLTNAQLEEAVRDGLANAGFSTDSTIESTVAIVMDTIRDQVLRIGS